MNTNPATRRSPIETLRNEPHPDIHDLPNSRKAGLKGPGLVTWLRRENIAIPSATYDIILHNDNSLIVRIAIDEVIIESPDSGKLVCHIDRRCDRADGGVYRTEQQAATFLLRGPKTHMVLEQTCGMNMASAHTEQIIYTRVAGVSCGIIPEENESGRNYRIWVDYSLAPSLFSTLRDICDAV